MTNENSKGKSAKNSKAYIQENTVPIVFGVFILMGIILSQQAPLFLMNELIKGFSPNAFMVLALLIPVMAGMGFNFSIGIGAIAGQIGILMVVNWGLSGFIGIVAAVIFATPLAILFGVLAGVVLNKARGYEMIASLFVGYLGNAIYQFVLLYLVGSVIPMTAGLLLTQGSGLKNSIDLKDTLGHSIDGLLQVPFFFLLILIGITLLALSMYRLKKDAVHSNKTWVNSSIILSAFVIIISAMIMYIDVLPKEISALKLVKFPLITGILIGLFAWFNLVITRTKIGQTFLEVGLNQKNSNTSKQYITRARILSIVISTVFASWGQIIFLQNTGILNTYGSHMNVGLMTVLALIVGGASIKIATVKHAILGIILVQSFLIITPLWLERTTPISFSILQTIVFNSVLLYAFVMSSSKRYNSERL